VDPWWRLPRLVLPCCWCYKQIFIIEVCVVWCASKRVKQRGMLDVFVIIIVETINEYAYCIVHRRDERALLLSSNKGLTGHLMLEVVPPLRWLPTAPSLPSPSAEHVQHTLKYLSLLSGLNSMAELEQPPPLAVFS
jgi:hypothetical protein